MPAFFIIASFPHSANFSKNIKMTLLPLKPEIFLRIIVLLLVDLRDCHQTFLKYLCISHECQISHSTPLIVVEVPQIF